MLEIALQDYQFDRTNVIFLGNSFSDREASNRSQITYLDVNSRFRTFYYEKALGNLEK